MSKNLPMFVLLTKGVRDMTNPSFEYYCRYLKGDEDALEGLVKSCSNALIRFAYCYVPDSTAAEEIMEDAIVALIMKRKQLDNEASFRSYLFKITRNMAIDHLRKWRRSVALEDVQNILLTEDMETSYSRRESNELIYIQMQSLPEQYRQILHLTYFEEFSLKQASMIMGKSMKQVYNLHARAKEALKQHLIKEGLNYEEL